MNTTGRVYFILAFMLSLAFVAGAKAQFSGGLGDAFPGAPGDQEGGRVTEMRVEPESQGAGGRVLIVVSIETAEGYKVGQDTIDIAVDAHFQEGELFLRQNGERLPETLEYVEGPFEAVLPVRLGDGTDPGEYRLAVTAAYVPCTVDGNLCLMQHRSTRDLSLTVTDGPVTPVEVPEAPAGTALEPRQEDGPAAGPQQQEDPFAGHSAVVAVLLAFAVGFALLLTPCVYPLIPVTIALVGATSERSWVQGLLHSVVYVLGISVTYALAGGVAGATGAWFGWLQHPAVSLILALVFIAMALAMFDVFTLDLNSQRLQRLRAKLQGRGGLAGLFGIGVLTGVGATACLAPVITSALAYVAEEGNAALGAAMFFAMAWGFGLPLVVLGTFSGVAQAAPRPGEWMNVVKHLLGLALLGVAVYYVGKSDLLSSQMYRFVLAGFLLGTAVFVGAFDRLQFEDGWYRRARKTFGLLLVAAAAVVFVEPYLARIPSGPAAREQVEWMELSPGTEVQMVVEANQPVLVDYWEEDCPACEKMLENTFVDPAVVAEGERFVFAKVDMTGVEAGSEVGRAFRERYRAPGFPVVALYNTEGELVRVLTGYVGPEEMLRELKSVE